MIRFGRITRLLEYSQGLEEYGNKLQWSNDMFTEEKQDGFPNRINTINDAYQMLLKIMKTHLNFYRIDASTRRKEIEIDIDF